MALKSAETIYKELLRNEGDIIIAADQASAIWQIFKRKALAVRRFYDLRYRAFMQASLMCAVEGSDTMSWLETLFRSSMKPNATVKGVVKAVVKKGMQKYYNEKVGAPEELYLTIVNSIAMGHRTYFDLIAADSEI